MQIGRESSSSERVYRPSLEQRIPALTQYGMLVACICILSFLILLLPGKEGLKLIFLPIFLLLTIMMGVVCLWRTRLLLVTSPQGIAYASVGYRIFTPWENVVGIGTRLERGNRTLRLISGLELRRPAPVFEASPWIRFLLLGMESPFNFIPISTVIKDWQRSEFARDVEHYIPQVMRNPWTGERW
ncbi:MAG TPA: hypothetical protein VKR06_05145 [Ktedonosporobacter sp.]|nr:hypothetical protein [Ktedonosporobacter sp.]